MSDTIISQIPVLDQSYSDERDLRCWVPVCLAGHSSGLAVKADIRVNLPQFRVALAWADRTADAPDAPRRLDEVFPDAHEARMRMTCNKLAEKGILMRNGRGYVMFEAARRHVTHYREAQ